MTCKDLVDLKKAVSCDKRQTEFLANIDGDFWNNYIGNKNLSVEELQEIQNHINEKVNNKIPPEKLVEAIINVKKAIYKNLSEQDFEEIRNGYMSIMTFTLDNYLNKERSSVSEKELKDNFDSITPEERFEIASQMSKLYNKQNNLNQNIDIEKEER